MSAPRLRPGRAQDRDAVLALAGRLAGDFPLPPWRTRAVAAEADKPALRSFFETAPGRDRAMLEVAENADGALIGCAFGAAKADFFDGAAVAHLEALVVDRTARGLGLGAAPLARFEAWAREIGARYASLNAFESDARAQAVYAAAGFAPEMRR